MLLSIVIPHYNLPKGMLKRCIDSIIDQAIPKERYEIIIIDDGSSEAPVWINDEYKEENIRLINNDHGGPGCARNTGIEEVHGKYIQFVDADDYLLKNRQLPQCLEFLESESPQILRFKYIVKTDDQPTENKERRIWFSNTISGAIYMRDYNLPGSPCTYFFQKKLAQEYNIRFTPNIFHEDEEFNTILHYHAQTLVDSNAELYCYRIREGSTTANKSKEFEEKRIENIFTIIERIANFKGRNASRANKIQSEAINHKLHMLSVDVIMNMMFDNRSATDIYDNCVSHLKPLGLFPLPYAKYSLKYRIFRLFANNRPGMLILRLIIPRKKPVKR